MLIIGGLKENSSGDVINPHRISTKSAGFAIPSISLLPANYLSFAADIRRHFAILFMFRRFDRTQRRRGRLRRCGFWPGGPLCIVEFHDFARLAEDWLDTGSGLPGDLDGDDDVDYEDLRPFVDEWLYYCPYGWPLK